MESTIVGAQKIISGLSCSVNLGAAKVLTMVTTVLLPLNASEKGSDVSIRDLCEMLHINRNSKYFEKGIKNRKQDDSYLMLKGIYNVNQYKCLEESETNSVFSFINQTVGNTAFKLTSEG